MSAEPLHAEECMINESKVTARLWFHLELCNPAPLSTAMASFLYRHRDKVGVGCSTLTGTS